MQKLGIALIANTFLLTASLLVAGPVLAQTTIKIDGSSTVFPVAEAVAEEFQALKKGQTRVTVGIAGTGGGFKKFCRGEIDISNASRPILKEEMDACKAAGISYIELPIAFDALTLAVHPQNTWVKDMTLADLKKIWSPESQGKVMSWKDVRPEWPDVPLKLYGAGADSGTFDYFTEAVNGKAKSIRADYTPSEDDNVLVQGIENDKGALGFIPYAYYAPHAKRMKALGIDGGKGAVLPSEKTVIDGSYAPLSRPLFIYVKASETKRPEIKEFVEFFLTKGEPLIQEVKYVPLPKSAYVTSLARFTAGETGTGFGGTPEVGLSIAQILAKKPVH